MPTEEIWWGPTKREVDADDLANLAIEPSPRKVTSRKMTVAQSDGSTSRIEVALLADEYFERLTKTPRPPKTPEPVWEEPTTQVAEIIAWLDALGVDPEQSISVAKGPRTGKGPYSDHPRDFLTAQEFRRLRTVPPEPRCISWRFGCDEPVAYHTPADACRRCWKYHHETGEWPSERIIAKRRSRAHKKTGDKPDGKT